MKLVESPLFSVFAWSTTSPSSIYFTNANMLKTFGIQCLIGLA